MPKIQISPVQPLILEGIGVQPQIPDPIFLMPGDDGFDISRHLMIGQLCLNVTDNTWYYRGQYRIYTMRGAILETHASDMTPWNATIAYQKDDYVSYVSDTEGFTNEQIYRAENPTNPGQSPESDPDIWILIGDTVSNIQAEDIEGLDSLLAGAGDQVTVSQSYNNQGHSAIRDLSPFKDNVRLGFDIDYTYSTNGDRDVTITYPDVSIPITDGTTSGYLVFGEYTHSYSDQFFSTMAGKYVWFVDFKFVRADRNDPPGAGGGGGEETLPSIVKRQVIIGEPYAVTVYGFLVPYGSDPIDPTTIQAYPLWRNNLYPASSDVVYEFPTPQATWQITHNTDSYPSLTVLSDDGAVLYADVDYVDRDNIIIAHSSPRSGRVILKQNSLKLN